MNYSTHTGIAFTTRKTVISGLTLISILLATIPSTRAELSSDVNLTVKNIEQPTTNQRSNQQQLASDYNRSMMLLEMGVSAQERGEDEEALFYYLQAAKTNTSNGYAFLLMGIMLDKLQNTEDGITCIKNSVILFQKQKDWKGYNLAIKYLKQLQDS